MSEVVFVDCRGMQCPAPILKIAKAARGVGGQPAVMEVVADDDDFPRDLQAWCRTTQAELDTIGEESGVHRAFVRLNGAASAAADSAANDIVHDVEPATAPAVTAPARPAGGMPRPPTAPPPAPRATPLATPRLTAPVATSAALLVPGAAALAPQTHAVQEPSGARTQVDLMGLRAPDPIVRLSIMLGGPEGAVEVKCDDPRFVTDVMAWAASTHTTVTYTKASSDGVVVGLDFPQRTAAVAALVPSVTSLPAPAPAALPPVAASPAVLQVPRENQMTLFVMHNDFESLMAAMLVANSAAAQGMETVIFFSLWGVNLLRGEAKRKTDEKAVPFLQRMMKWMMPKGPKRQKLGQMHMMGMGKGMMQYFIKKNNVMSLDELMQQAVEQNVRFMVCSMSMGIMGIQRRDLIDAPNIEYGGVSSFVEEARKSASAMVF